MAIQSIILVEKEIEAIYGFGSFFRDESFNDIDVLAVASLNNTNTLSTFYKISAALGPVSVTAQAPIHLTLLTASEYRSRPLRNMNELKLLWAMNGVINV